MFFATKNAVEVVGPEFYAYIQGAMNATTKAELDDAGKHFATAVANGLLDATVAAQVGKNIGKNGRPGGQLMGEAAVEQQAKAQASAAARNAENGATTSSKPMFGQHIFGEQCFVAGTPLMTPSGHKAIEQFRPGDTVLSRHQHDPSGPIEAKEVEEIFVRVGPVLDLQVNGRLIRTTGEHPFYVAERGWLCAKELAQGDRLVSHDGRLVIVESVSDCIGIDTVYNLRVADYHTYFVGCDEWQFSVWAHNAEYVFQEIGDNLYRVLKKNGNQLEHVVDIEATSAADAAKKIGVASNNGKRYQVITHGDPNFKPRGGNESHHGVMSRWMEENFGNYNPDKAPAVLMELESHNATRGVYNTWRAEMRQKMGGTFDWAKVSEADIRALSERMFDAAGVPASIRAVYYAQFSEFLKTLKPK